MQINLTGFLNGKNARIFMEELWKLMLSAMENIGGIPAEFLEQKKEEIKKRQVVGGLLILECDRLHNRCRVHARMKFFIFY